MAEREPLFDEEEPPGPRFGRGKTPGSRAVRVIISLVAVAAVVFVVWWLYLTRSVREQAGPSVERARPTTATVKPPVPDSSRAGGQEGGSGSTTPEVTPATGTAGEATVRGGETATPERRVETAAPEPREGAVQTPRIVSSTPDSVFFVQTLDRFADQYVIHVSSFRGTEKAREEVLFLAGRGYPVFVYHVDLGSKGMWYRVYVGPYATRDEAMESKIKLDEIPRITSTRLSKVPG